MMDQFGPILRKGLRSGIWIFGLIMALNNAGYDVGALIAGVGIGGLALAMAAKDFVSNMFGGITVFVDQPFKVGDRIQISGYDGTIEEIGLRSTRLRTLAGRIVIIPNFKFTDTFLENVTNEPSRKASLTLGLTYDTSPEQVEEAIGILKAIIAERAETLEHDPTIWFDSFGDFSLNVKLVYYIKKGGPLGLQSWRSQPRNPQALQCRRTRLRLPHPNTVDPRRRQRLRVLPIGCGRGFRGRRRPSRRLFRRGWACPFRRGGRGPLQGHR